VAYIYNVNFSSVSGTVLVFIRSQVVILDLEVRILMPLYQGLYEICRYFLLGRLQRIVSNSFALDDSCLYSDFYRFSPTGILPGHPSTLSPHSHPAIVTPGIKQELIQSEINHRFVLPPYYVFYFLKN
jgi:hypothetical protein